jgi:hypothetical protein
VFLGTVERRRIAIAGHDRCELYVE